MRRGVLDISRDSLQLLLDYINNETEFDFHTKQKIESALAEQSALTQIELSEAETEALLDLLPPPTVNQSQTQSLDKTTRQTLSNFFRKIK